MTKLLRLELAVLKQSSYPGEQLKPLLKSPLKLCLCVSVCARVGRGQSPTLGVLLCHKIL